jgi:hypothetical protein
MLILACRQVTFHAFGHALLHGAMDFSDGLLRLLHAK